MTWRRQPPVRSPVSFRALVDGIGAVAGVGRDAADDVRAMLRKQYGSADALLTDSGTSALILALRKLVPTRGTVAYPAYACIDLTTAALGARVRVRLYDINPATLSPDLDSVRAVMARGVDAIVVAHLYGYPADVTAVRRIADENGIPLIEDAAQAAGGSLHGSPLGALGDIAVRSFGRGKGTTGGAGGALLAKTPLAAAWTNELRTELAAGSHGMREVITLAAQEVFSHRYLYSLPASIPGLKLGEMVYHAPLPPRAMSAASAATLRRTLELEPREIAARRARAEDLTARINGLHDVVSVRPVSGGTAGFLRLAVVDTAGARHPRADLGALRGYPLTLDQHQQLQPLLCSGERAGSGSRLLRDRLFTLPTHSRVCQSDIARLADWLGRSEVESGVLAAAT